MSPILALGAGGGVGVVLGASVLVGRRDRGFYGGRITSDLAGPFKGVQSSRGW